MVFPKVDREKLIKIVKENRILWDKSNESHSNVEEKNKIWEEIAASMGTCSTRIRQCWSNLVEVFEMELGKKEEINEESEWPYFEEMLFLVRGHESLDEEVTEEEEDMATEEDEGCLAEDTVENWKSTLKCDKRRIAWTSRSTQTDVKQMIRRQMTNENMDDSDWQFLVSLVPFMKRILPSRQLSTRIRLLEVLSEEVETQRYHQVPSVAVHVNNEAQSL